MNDYPQASLTLDKKDKSYYTATCPQHNRVSHKMIGGQQDLERERVYWTFHCAQNIKGAKQGHTFLALVDRHAPKDADEYSSWRARQIERRLNPYLKGLR